MLYIVEILFTFTLAVICFQFYWFSTSSKGVERQERCRNLGITFMTVGIVALVFRTLTTVVFGFIMMMLGFRLIASGLDRLDKTIFIDRHEDDE